MMLDCIYDFKNSDQLDQFMTNYDFYYQHIRSKTNDIISHFNLNHVINKDILNYDEALDFIATTKKVTIGNIVKEIISFKSHIDMNDVKYSISIIYSDNIIQYNTKLKIDNSNDVDINDSKYRIVMNDIENMNFNIIHMTKDDLNVILGKLY